MIEPKTLKKDQRCWAFITLTNPASSRHDDWNSPTEVNVYFSIPKLVAEVKWINMRGQQSNEIDKSRLRNLRLKRVKRQQLRGNLLWSTASKWTEKKKPSQSRAVKISFTAPWDTRQILMKWEFESSVYKTNRKEEEAESHP